MPRNENTIDTNKIYMHALEQYNKIQKEFEMLISLSKWVYVQLGCIHYNYF